MASPTPIQNGQQETDSPSRITSPITKTKGILYGLAVEKCERDWALAMFVAGQDLAAQTRASLALAQCLENADQGQMKRDFWYNFRRYNRGQGTLPGGAPWYDITPDPYS